MVTGPQNNDLCFFCLLCMYLFTVRLLNFLDYSSNIRSITHTIISYFCHFVASGLHDGEQDPVSEVRLGRLCDFRGRQHGHAPGSFFCIWNQTKNSVDTFYLLECFSDVFLTNELRARGWKERLYHKAWQIIFALGYLLFSRIFLWQFSSTLWLL